MIGRGRISVRFLRHVILLVAAALLTGFGSEETEVLIMRCVERGNSEDACRCVLKFEEEVFGPKFLEAMYLQAIGDLQSYEQKLYETVAQKPKALQNMAELEARAKARCTP